MHSKISIKRIYEEPSEADGYRVLVDRLWPRGISKDAAKLNEWNKEIAPSTELRKWFDHQPARFDEFVERYHKELKGNEAELKHLLERAEENPLCLLYAAKNPALNQAIVLKDLLSNLK